VTFSNSVDARLARELPRTPGFRRLDQLVAPRALPRARLSGRPSKFSEETRSKVLDALRAGVFPSTAAEYAGISYETLRVWMRKGEADRAAELDTEVADFSVTVTKVIATAPAPGSCLAGATP
jgi:hypothetical protein